MTYNLDESEPNAHHIIKGVRKVLRAGGVSEKQIEAFQMKAISGSRADLILLVKRTVNVPE